MYKKLAILIIVILAVVFFVSSQKPSLAQTPTINYWNASAPYSVVSHPRPSFIAGDYYYVLLVDRKIAYAKIKTDGSLDSWQIATTLQAEADTRPNNRGYAAVVINNVPYLLRFGRVEKLIINQSGDVTEIQQVGSASGGNDSIGGNTYYWNTAVVATFASNTYVYSLGGHNMQSGSTNNNIFRSSNTSSTQWQWQAMGEGAYQNPYKAVFYRPEGADYGYIYVGDLHTEEAFNPNYPDHLYQVKVKNDGTFDSGWTLTTDLPAKDAADPNSFGEMFVSGSTLFVTRGRKVYSATITDHGALTAWSDAPADLPDFTIDKDWGPSAGADHTDGNSVGIKNNFVYITGKDKVYFTQFGGTGPSTSPNPSTTGPAPTRPPCPGPANAGIKFPFQADPIKNIENFNSSGGLKLLALKTLADGGCQVVIEGIRIANNPAGIALTDYLTENTVNLPAGNYTFYLSGPRNLPEKFEEIKVTAGQTLDCTQASPPTDCGDFGNPAKRGEKRLLSGNASTDPENVINTIDFELYRQNVGQNASGNNADFDYNGTVEYKDGTGDDFEIFKRNFGETGVYGCTGPSC